MAMKHVATMHVAILREREGAKDEPDVRSNESTVKQRVLSTDRTSAELMVVKRMLENK